MEQKNRELYEVVDEELHQNGKDYNKVDKLTEEIVQLRIHLKEYSDRKKQAEAYRIEMKQLLKQLKKLQDEDTERFHKEIYSMLVEQATVFEDGKVRYKLTLGIEWTTDETFADYKSIA